MIDDAPSHRFEVVSHPQSGRASGSRAKRSGRLNDRVQADIGRQLKMIYDAVVNEDVPESLLELLGQVDDAPGNSDKPKKR